MIIGLPTLGWQTRLPVQIPVSGHVSKLMHLRLEDSWLELQAQITSMKK